MTRDWKLFFHEQSNKEEKMEFGLMWSCSANSDTLPSLAVGFMLDPFIGFCKEGNLTVEHTLPHSGEQQELTSVNMSVFFFMST